MTDYETLEVHTKPVTKVKLAKREGGNIIIHVMDDAGEISSLEFMPEEAKRVATDILALLAS